MQQRRLGRSGLKVSSICLGTMTFAGQADEATSMRILDAAFEEGVTFIDTADAYPIPPEPETAGFTEEVIGRWLVAEPGRRDGLVLATCDSPLCLSRASTEKEALEKLRAEIRYRIEWCPCTGVGDDYVQLEIVR